MAPFEPSPSPPDNISSWKRSWAAVRSDPRLYRRPLIVTNQASRSLRNQGFESRGIAENLSANGSMNYPSELKSSRKAPSSWRYLGAILYRILYQRSLISRQEELRNVASSCSA